MAEETYQGWTNRETWCVALWLNNEQGLQEGAQRACNQPNEMLHEAVQTLEDYVDELVGDPAFSNARGFTLDLVNCALARCDFKKIAETFREEAQS